MRKSLPPLVVFFVALFVYTEQKQGANFTSKNATLGQGSKDDHFDFMVYTQQWPETFRLQTGPEVQIPENVTGWTIHGLWPSQIKKEAPNFCNSSWTFNESLIHDLGPQLSLYWPNMLKTNNLWAHEWTKHGTCGAPLAAIHGEHNYFATGLRLNAKYNITEMLATNNIMPSANKAYAYKDVEGAIRKNVNNMSFVMQCYWDKKAKKQYISQVMLCLDKQFGLLECDKYLSEGDLCWTTETIQYPPFQYDFN
ncbi:ribonuclease Oy-like isoform X1 [Branchiostoma lanceolatum]|uniref:ribonuclease Oy-like isoform X1 n=1 Tax=Branchiostoma lanceolatum TaxID=7740 RepID=UPI003451DAB0